MSSAEVTAVLSSVAFASIALFATASCFAQSPGQPPPPADDQDGEPAHLSDNGSPR
ncbi:hypothetical protein [Streptomyces sp. H39-C1]|uniref:hypothetical protein n=1 Tax=Streptomyces sp. H39-C1 TaxID=3004355 RepID=UPI0022B02206|nr:hypothetical protein [Streptomyces sp. H39-C1]MCZ4100757.1 hypothetical protein [Streptomyces sp. H39-C1]